MTVTENLIGLATVATATAGAPEQLGRGRLVVVIPALNEVATIGDVVRAVPRRIPGFADVRIIVVDDGSTDGTGDEALAANADDVIRHRARRGLVAAFNRGMRAALRMGADVIVHLDGDGQHDPSFVPVLAAPILTGGADVVVGVRPLAAAREMSPVRRHGNRFGSWVFRRLLGLPIRDATSGYRAFSREALLHLNVVTDCTYTLETLIQAARKGLAVAQVVVPPLPRVAGDSRMTSSLWRYVRQSTAQALRTLLHTNAAAIFARAGIVLILLAVGCTGWFLFGYRDGGMHLPALLAAVLLAVLGVGVVVSGLIADGINRSHRLLEDILYNQKQLESESAARISSMRSRGL